MCRRGFESSASAGRAMAAGVCGTIHQASAPERPIAKGLASPGLLAHVLIAKYCDHLPLYRQSQISARHGVEIDCSTLANWVGGTCWWLEPLRAPLAAHVFGIGQAICRRHADPCLSSLTVPISPQGQASDAAHGGQTACRSLCAGLTPPFLERLARSPWPKASLILEHPVRDVLVSDERSNTSRCWKNSPPQKHW